MILVSVNDLWDKLYDLVNAGGNISTACRELSIVSAILCHPCCDCTNWQLAAEYAARLMPAVKVAMEKRKAEHAECLK